MNLLKEEFAEYLMNKETGNKNYYDQINEMKKPTFRLERQLHSKVKANKEVIANLETFKKEGFKSIQLNHVMDNLKDTFNFANATLEDRLKIVKAEENLAKEALNEVKDTKLKLNASRYELALYGRSSGVRLVKPMTPGHISGVVVGKETAVTFDDKAEKDNICEDLWAIIGKAHKA